MYIRTAHTDGKNWKQEMYKFLRQYRATPHSTTDISPSEALNQRKLKITLPELALVKHGQQQIKPQSAQSKITKTDADKKLKMKIYADTKAHARETSIKPGEVVLMSQPKCNKLCVSIPCVIQDLSLSKPRKEPSGHSKQWTQDHNKKLITVQSYPKNT